MEQLEKISSYYKIPFQILEKTEEKNLFTILFLSDFLKKGKLLNLKLWRELFLILSEKYPLSDKQIYFFNLNKKLIDDWETIITSIDKNYYNDNSWELEDCLNGLKDLLVAKENENVIIQTLSSLPPNSALILPWEDASTELKTIFSVGGDERYLIIAPSNDWKFERFADNNMNNFTEFLSPSGKVVWVLS